ncbi:hypothetical protein AABB24_019534, partial [Solanum stoloniferum]
VLVRLKNRNGELFFRKKEFKMCKNPKFFFPSPIFPPLASTTSNPTRSNPKPLHQQTTTRQPDLPLPHCSLHCSPPETTALNPTSKLHCKSKQHHPFHFSSPSTKQQT